MYCKSIKEPKVDGIVPWMRLPLKLKSVSLPEIHVRPIQVLAQGPGPEKFHVFYGSHVPELVLALKSLSAFSSAGDIAITEVIRQSKNQCLLVTNMIVKTKSINLRCFYINQNQWEY